MDQDEEMGQSSNKESRQQDEFQNDDLLYTFDDLDDNGLYLNDIYLPKEILVDILSHVDNKTINRSCRLVCKNWYNIIREVWKVKAEREHPKLFEPYVSHKRFPWPVYRSAVLKNTYGRNLLKNNTGQDKLKHWEIETNEGDKWKVEMPPIGVPGAHNKTYDSHTIAFVTSYGICVKKQVIDLWHEGLSPYMIDFHRPDIVISEWYTGRWDCPSKYMLDVFLLNKNKEILETFNHSCDTDQFAEGWHEVKHTFTNYGPGVRYVVFRHGGKDKTFWAGHYGSKMSNASVIIPLDGIGEYRDDDESDPGPKKEYVDYLSEHEPSNVALWDDGSDVSDESYESDEAND